MAKGTQKAKEPSGEERYQVQVQAILIGSKENGQKPSVSKSEVADLITQKLQAELQPKDFSSGNKGFFGQFKVEVTHA